VRRTANRGPAAARNEALGAAAGAYVLPLDADDYLDPAFLARTVPILDAEPGVGIVHTWVGLVGGHVGTWKTGPATIPALLARCTLHVTSPLPARARRPRGRVRSELRRDRRGLGLLDPARRARCRRA
jgi:glycosyltransferase involved in cell wall biosynthesis